MAKLLAFDNLRWDDPARIGWTERFGWRRGANRFMTFGRRRREPEKHSRKDGR
jgi:hypothetical protein